MAWSWRAISSNGLAMHLKPGAGEERISQSAKPIQLTVFLIGYGILSTIRKKTNLCLQKAYIPSAKRDNSIIIK